MYTTMPKIAGEAVAIGIDLGTAHSRVGVWRDGRVEMISEQLVGTDNNLAKYLSRYHSIPDHLIRSHLQPFIDPTPSLVTFTESGRLIGDDAAKGRTSVDISNAVFDAKRLIGRKFDDPGVQLDMKRWPFTVVSEPRGAPVIEMKYEGGNKSFKAEEISSMVLGKMREIAEDYLGMEVKDAVISVPACFNDSQRRATKIAGKMSGLNVLRVINEPTAAAISHSLDEKGEERNVLIFDLGAGTFDVSLVTIEDGIVEVRATAGDARLGGEDFNDRIVDFLAEEFKRRHGVEVSRNPRSLLRLRAACEEAKRALSGSERAHIVIDSLCDGVGFEGVITRARFEELCMDHFEKCIGHCEEVLAGSHLSKGDIHDVVLVGGSTRIPAIRSMLKAFFEGNEREGNEPRTIDNVDDIVAHGAAVQAAILSSTDCKSERLSELLILDVTAHSLGILKFGGDLINFIKRNTTIPAKKTWVFSSYANGRQRSFYEIQVFEGEQTLARDNNRLGGFCLYGVPPMSPDRPNIVMTFSIDFDGILSVSAAVEDPWAYYHYVINVIENR